MPIREKAMMPAKPDSRTAVVSIQALLVAPELNNAADNRLNLATKPDKGGKPIISKAHAKKAIPKNTMGTGKGNQTESSKPSTSPKTPRTKTNTGTGKGMPTVSSKPSSSPKSRRSKASSLTAKSSEPNGCKRLTISSSKKNAPTANTELSK